MNTQTTCTQKGTQEYYTLPFDRVSYQTDKAAKIGKSKIVWLPKSQCTPVVIGETKCLLVPKWLYVQNRPMLGYLASCTASQAEAALASPAQWFD